MVLELQIIRRPNTPKTLSRALGRVLLIIKASAYVERQFLNFLTSHRLSTSEPDAE